MTKPAPISLFSLIFAVSAVACASAPHAERGHRQRRPGRGLWRWDRVRGSLVLLAGAMGSLGNVALAGAPPQVLGVAEAIAGGAILALVAQVMMPHAFEGGGRFVSLSTIAGFLLAFLLSTAGL